MKYQDKYTASNGRSKYQEKEGPKVKFNFVYDEKKITYRTQIDQMPQKTKYRPDQKNHTKKTSDLEAKIEQLKKQRKAKKQEYKNGTQGFRKQIQQQKRKIQLGKKCLAVLNYDKDNLQKEATQIDDKIGNHQRKIQFIQRPAQKQGKPQSIDQMNFVQLMKQQSRIQSHMSSAALSKAQQVQLSSKLNKIKKRRLQVPKMVQSNKEDLQKTKQIQHHRNSIERLKVVRERLNQNIQNIKTKLQSIKEDMEQFSEKIEQLHQKQSTNDNNTLLEQAEQLKQKIYALRDQLVAIEQQYQNKKYDYQYQQEKINWIKWANTIKQQRKEEWEEQKQERKRQKQRQKKYGPKPTDRKEVDKQKDGDKQNGDKQKGQKDLRNPEFQRKKINKNQKQIDVCSFLIQYCKDLNSTGSSSNEADTNKEPKNIQDALKKGEWAKMKGVQVIQSKKAKIDQDKQEKPKKKQKQVSTNPVQIDRFSHTYFVAQTFDSVKVLPPSKKQDLQKAINQLQDKLQYYLAHPDEGVQRNAEQNKKQGEKILTKDNYSKVKQTRGKLINTEEFPSLS